MSNLLANSNLINKLENLDKLEKNGKQLYNQNEYYQNIVNLMEHPEFRKLFDAHFFEWENIQLIVMFMKLYEHIEKSSTIKLNGYQKLYLVDRVMKTRHLRQQICDQIQKSTKDLKTLKI
jgi:hypothetical protein